MGEYEQSLLKVFDGGEYESIGSVSYAAVRGSNSTNVDLSWFAGSFHRFHEIRVALPREDFVACVGCEHWDEKPRVFVRIGWLERLHLRSYSVFALLDASDFTDGLRSGAITREKLVSLREAIDAVAKKYPDVLFVSFADSLLLKSNWSVGHYKSGVKYTYAPEKFIWLISDVRSAYLRELELSVYAVLTQGDNVYDDDPLSQTSTAGNHISLNSLGLPFAQLQSIEKAARECSKDFGRAELYMEESFFRSLRPVGFQLTSCRRHCYQEPLTGREGFFYSANCQEVIENLDRDHV